MCQWLRHPMLIMSTAMSSKRWTISESTPPFLIFQLFFIMPSPQCSLCVDGTRIKSRHGQVAHSCLVPFLFSACFIDLTPLELTWWFFTAAPVIMLLAWWLVIIVLFWSSHHLHLWLHFGHLLLMFFMYLVRSCDPTRPGDAYLPIHPSEQQ